MSKQFSHHIELMKAAAEDAGISNNSLVMLFELITVGMHGKWFHFRYRECERGTEKSICDRMKELLENGYIQVRGNRTCKREYRLPIYSLK